MKVTFQHMGHTVESTRSVAVTEMYIDSKICDNLKGLMDTQGKPFDLTGTWKNEDGTESVARIHAEPKMVFDEVSFYVDDKLIDTSKGSND